MTPSRTSGAPRGEVSGTTGSSSTLRRLGAVGDRPPPHLPPPPAATTTAVHRHPAHPHALRRHRAPPRRRPPPGAKREWRIDRDLPLLSGLLAEVLSDDPSFVLLSAHDPRWPVAALDGQLREITRGASAVRGRCERGEMLLRARGGGRDLPMGVYSRWAAGTV